MVDFLLVVLLSFPAVLVALPAISDLWAWLAGRPRVQPPEAGGAWPKLVFLVPAHDEELLIRRSVDSLLAQDYPGDRLLVVVVADNCSDATAAVARDAGAVVLERVDLVNRGKGKAIQWALERLPLASYSAVVVIDADTVVEPDFASQIARWAPLEEKVLQTYDGLSNEFENWLTRMAGVLTRNRYDLVLPLKARAGLSCPLTGDGIVLGTELLRRHRWRVETITEGWELYARLTLAGVRVAYEPRARFYAQEAKSLGQSASQRQRWTAGRYAVLRKYGLKVLAQPDVPLLQRVDLLAELTSPGPVVRALGGLGGCALTWAILPEAKVQLLLFASGVLQPFLYSTISLVRHPDPWRTGAAFLRLPLYAIWRLGVGLRALTMTGTSHWVRTGRAAEPEPAEVASSDFTLKP